MPKNNEIDFGEIFNLPNPGLRSYFDIVRRGQPDVFRTTFAKGQSVESVLDEWKPTIDSIADKWPSLLDFENDLKAKVGPMSVMKPLSERMDDIEHYYTDILLSATPVSDRALRAVIAEMGPVRGLLVRSQDRTVDKMKLSTNSGAPYFTKRKNVVCKTLWCNTMMPPGDLGGVMLQGINKLSDLSKLCPQFSTDTNASVWLPCAVLGWRGQEGGPLDVDTKQRVVWMFPFAVNVNELQVYQPLIECCQRFNLFPAWNSMDAVDWGITRMFDTKGVDDMVICTDFSRFDQHFNHVLQTATATILQALLTDNRDAAFWLKNVFPIKYKIPLAYDYGKVRYGAHGMGSGSGGTNADETIAHRALQYEAALANHQVLNRFSQCMGDDGVLTYPGITVEDVMRSYTAHGLEMNESKQYASKHDCVYLRRWHHINYRKHGICVGVYSTYRALGRLMEQERYYDPEIWSKEMVALRQLSILENVKYHPLCAEFADFCMKRDKYRLGLDIPGFLDDIDKIAQEAIDLIPEFMGYTKSQQRAQEGISSWWIVQYLKSKR